MGLHAWPNSTGKEEPKTLDLTRLECIRQDRVTKTGGEYGVASYRLRQVESGTGPLDIDFC